MGGLGRWRQRASRGVRVAWKKVRRPRAGEPSHNILAVSDLHLGLELRGQKELSPVPAIDLALGPLLEHMSAHPEDGRPWRLLVVGDMVDFIAITELPKPGEVSFEVSELERRCGLGPEPEKAVWKLSRVLDRHAFLIERLARFVAAGHELVILRGNHDVDWCWPEVQSLFRERLLDLGLTRRRLSARRGQEVREAMSARIRFEDWCHLEPGRVHAEHGHHYDEFSVTEDLMRRPPSERRLSEPVSTLALRYFGNRHTGLDLGVVDRWNMLDYLRWAHRQGGILKPFTDYLQMCLRVSAYTLRASFRTMLRSLGALLKLPRDMAFEGDKLHHLKEMLKSVRSDHEELARQVALLMKPPAARSFWLSARMLYLDRILLALGLLVAASGAWGAAGPPLLRAGVFALVLAGAGVLNAWLDRVRLIESHPKLLDAAHRISVLFSVPVVIMGHSHKPVFQKVGEGALYINLGTWLGKNEEGFPHAVITDAGAQLRRWRPGRQKASADVA